MPKTLLLADDSVTIQKVVGLTFANEDVTLVTVDNGDDAIARAKAVRPDLVLADVVMPGRNGYEVCEALKADPSLRHVPVLLLSGTFEAFDEERARRAGADGHLTKPFEAQALVETVHRLLAQSASAAPAAQAVATPPAAVATAPPASDDGLGADAGYDFFDDDLIGEGQAAAPAAAPDVADPTATLTTAAADAPTEVESVYEKTMFELSEAEAIDDASSDVEAATDALFEDDADLGSTVVAAMEEDEEPFDLGSAASTPAAAAAPLDPFADDARDPLASLARTGSGISPASPAPYTEEISAPDFGAMPGARAVEQGLGGAGDPNAGSWRDLPDADLGMSIRDFEDSKRALAPAAEPASTTAAGGFGPAGLDLGASDRTPTAPSFSFPDASSPETSFASSPATSVASSPETSFATSQPITEPSFAPPAAAPAAAPAPAAPEPLEAALVDDDDEVPFEEAIPFGPTGAMAELDDEPLAFSAPPEPATPVAATPAASAAHALPDLSPMLRQRVHDTLEKVAWEAFADLSDTIVRQVLARVEAVAWEVIPAMAEALVREEIRRMKGDVE